MARSPFAPTRVAPSPGSVIALGGPRTRKYQPLRLGDRSPSLSPSERDAASVDPIVAAFESAKADGFAEGRQAGLEAGNAQARQDAEELREALESSTRELAGLRSVLAEAYRQELVELALCTAEAAMGAALHDGETKISALVEEALAAMHGAECFSLRVSEADAERTRTWAADAGLENVHVAADAALCAGDFKLQCAAGSVASIMAERLDRVRQLVVGKIKGAAPT